MYTSGQPGTVVALDATTGRQIWRFTRERKVRNPNEINPFNRGVAVLGNRLFVGTLDAALVAIDARTGSLLWETQVADSLLGYSITSSPLDRQRQSYRRCQRRRVRRARLSGRV